MRPASANATTSGGDIKKFARTSELMRPSKFRFPESTEATTSSFSSMASENFRRQRSGVSDAGGASIADEMKFQFLEIRGQPGLAQIVGHDFRSGSQRSFYPGGNGQSFLDGFLGKQSGAISTDGFEVLVQDG